MGTTLIQYRLSEELGIATKICAAIITAGGVAVFMTEQIAGTMLIGVGVIPFLMFKCIEIDMYSGTYCLGINLLGYTFGSREPYPGVKCIFIKKNRTIHQSSRHSWRATTSTSFDGFLWLDDDTKILLTQDSSKENALLKLQSFADQLKIEIKDLTAPLSHI